MVASIYQSLIFFSLLFYPTDATIPCTHGALQELFWFYFGAPLGLGDGVLGFNDGGPCWMVPVSAWLELGHDALQVG